MLFNFITFVLGTLQLLANDIDLMPKVVQLLPCHFLPVVLDAQRKCQRTGTEKQHQQSGAASRFTDVIGSEKVTKNPQPNQG